MSDQLTIEQAMNGYVVGSLGIGLYKRFLIIASVKNGISFKVSHYHYPALETTDIAAAVAFYNNDPEPPPAHLIPKLFTQADLNERGEWKDAPPVEDMPNIDVSLLKRGRSKPDEN